MCYELACKSMIFIEGPDQQLQSNLDDPLLPILTFNCFQLLKSVAEQQEIVCAEANVVTLYSATDFPCSWLHNHKLMLGCNNEEF